MEFKEALIPARLVKRYKRFLADVVLDSGEEITVHCPNTGSMKRCQQENARVWLSDSHNEKRKYRHTWELVEVDQQYLACINTARPNALVKEGIERGVITQLQGYDAIRGEVKYGENSRIDWLLTRHDELCYVEVKNVTLLEEDGTGYFPDSVTDRGRKHLYELADMVAQGHRAVLLFCVSHTGIHQIMAAQHIDPKYAASLAEVRLKGVEVIAYRLEIDKKGLEVSREVPVLFA